MEGLRQTEKRSEENFSALETKLKEELKNKTEPRGERGSPGKPGPDRSKEIEAKYQEAISRMERKSQEDFKNSATDSKEETLTKLMNLNNYLPR